MRELRRRHNVAWLDESIPALGGQTPREAARTAKGRAALDVLLKDIENREMRAGGGAAADVAWLRHELGLEEPGGRKGRGRSA